jgi:hypothetical protein
MINNKLKILGTAISGIIVTIIAYYYGSIILFSILKNNHLEELIQNINNISQLLLNNWNDFPSLFAKLSSAQQGALAHIFSSLAVYYSAMNIASAYYGDKLIEYFKLETKYPRLARWIQYRRTYQHYNVALNLILILFISGYVIYANVSIFKYL